MVKEERRSSEWRDTRPVSSRQLQHQPPQQSQPGPSVESTITRRREANRLAAQRFRNRKKGYQDSLEERVRQLEEENLELVRRCELAEGYQRTRPRSSPGFDRSQRLPEHYPFSSGGHTPGQAPPSSSDDKMRISSLEGENRILTDELKMMREENERLRNQLERERGAGHPQDFGRPVEPVSVLKIFLSRSLDETGVVGGVQEDIHEQEN